VEICLLFGRHIVDSISHKSLHEYHSLDMSGCGSAGKGCFLSLFVKHMGPWICCVLNGNHKVHSACNARPSRPPSICFSVLLKARC